MQPYPRSPDLVWPGHLHGTGCLSARAVGTGFPTVGLRLWLGPGCGWSWVLFTPAPCGWGLGWVCLGSVCGAVPLLPAVCGVRGWALVSACFRDLCGFVRVSLAPRRFWFRCAVWACVLGPGLGCAPPFLAGLSVCVSCALFFFNSFFRLLGVPVPGLVVSPPVSFLSGWAAGFFFFFLLVSVPLFPVGRCTWLGVAGFGPVVPLCLFGGPVFGALRVGGLAPFCVFGWRFGGCGLFSRAPPLFFLGGGGGAWLFLPLPSLGWRLLCGWCVVWLVPRHSWRRFLCATPRHSWLGFAAGGGGRSPPPLAGVCRRRWCVVCGGGVLVGLWLVCGVVGPSPLLAEVPVCYSPPLLAGFRCRWWWAVPATPGWGPLAALLCGVWCVAVVCWGGCGWCVVWLVPRHSWRRFLCATPRHSWLGFAAGGGGRSPPLLTGVCLRRWCVVCGVWCVVCGGGVLVGLWLVCGVVGPSPLLAVVPVCYSLPLLAGFRCRWWWAVPATPGWGPLAASVCGVWRWCVVGVVVGVWCGWSLATPGGGPCVLLPATPGWVLLPVVVGGPRHSWLGSVGGGGVWCVVCGVWCVVCCWGPSPLLAEVPVCYSPPLLAGFRCRWWWAVPATPGWGPLAALLCGVWCVAVVYSGGCGWCVVWLVPRHSWRRFLCATPRHSWLGFAAGGGGRSPPLLTGVCLRRWCVVCGVWCVVCGGGVLVGLWLVCGVVGPSPLLAVVPVCYSLPLLAGFRCRWWWAVPATPGWGPLAASVCGVWRWCVVGVVVGVWCGWSLATPGGGPCVLLPATPGWVLLPVVVGGPRHSWLGSVGGGGVWCVVCGVWCVVCCWGPSPLLAEVPVCYSPPLLAGFRCRWWWAVPATPGWGLLAALVCVLCLAGSGGPASRARSGAPHLFLWPLCLSALLGPLWAAVAPLSFAAVAVPRWLFFSASRCLAPASFVSPAWPLAALWWLLPRPPPPLCLAVFVAPACGLGVFSFFLLLLLPPSAPLVSGFLWFPAPGALGLGACVVCFVGLPLLGSPCACPSFVLSAWLLAAPA